MSARTDVPNAAVPGLPARCPSPVATAGELASQLARRGSPLVHPLNPLDHPHADGAPGSGAPGSGRECIVTFAWRGEADHVAVFPNKLAGPADAEAGRCERIAGSDVWHASWRVRADWVASYHFVVDGVRHADPLNPRQMPSRRDGSTLSVVDLTRKSRWEEPRPDVPRGRVRESVVHSEILGGERRVWVYTPPALPPRPAVLVLLDGQVWAQQTPVRHTLDNLIAAGRIPPTVAVLPDSVGQETRGRELTCNPDFTGFLAAELLPHLAESLPVTPDPRRTVIAGQSFGGLAAAYAALTCPERFGLALCQSGSFWWPSGTYFNEDAEWLTREFARRKRVPARFAVQAGLLENPSHARHFVTVLTARGYDVRYREVYGGHDHAWWRRTLADGLAALRIPASQ